MEKDLSTVPSQQIMFYIDTSVCVFMPVCIYVRIFLSLCLCLFVSICKCVYVCIYTYVCSVCLCFTIVSTDSWILFFSFQLVYFIITDSYPNVHSIYYILSHIISGETRARDRLPGGRAGRRSLRGSNTHVTP